MRVLVALLAVAASGSCFAAAAAVPVFSRQVLTDVSWLEMEVRDARRVTATLREQPQTFTFGIGLTFFEMRRTETESRSVRGRSLALAGNFTEGAPAWDAFRSRLLEFARRTEPEQLDQLLTRGQLFDPSIPGDYVIAACEGGGADRPEVGYELVREGPRGGFTTFSNAAPLCAELADAHRFTEPSAVLIARMTVAAAQEQVIEWTEVDRTARPPEPLPGGITVVREGPPPGATAWSHAQPGTYATLITDERGEPSHALRTEVTARALDPAALEGRALLARLSARTIARAFGRAPAESPAEVFSVDLAFVFADTSAVHSDALLAALATELAKADGLADAATLRLAVINNALALGPERAFAVACSADARGEVSAELCANRACSTLEDPRNVCAGLAAGLP